MPLAGREPEGHRRAQALRAEMAPGAETASTMFSVSSHHLCVHPPPAGAYVSSSHRQNGATSRAPPHSCPACCTAESNGVPQSAVLPDVPSVGDRTPGMSLLRQVAPKGSSSQNPQDPLWDPGERVRGMAPFLRSFERRAWAPGAPWRVRECVPLHSLSVWCICRTNTSVPLNRSSVAR